MPLLLYRKEVIAMSFLYIILGVLVVFLAFKFVGTWAGLILIALVLLYGIYHFIPSYYVIMGNRAFSEGKDEESCAWYKKAYDTGRTKVEVKTSYAYILMRTGNADEAERVLDTIIRVKGLAPQKKNLAKQQRAMVYYKQGRLDEALEEAQELFDSGYKTVNLYGMMGYFKQLHGDPLDETLAICEEAYDYDDENRDILDNLSICYYKLGRYEDAERISDKLLENNTEFVEGCYHGAQIAMKLGKTDKARKCLEMLSKCKRSGMTTITEEEIKLLADEVNNNENTAS